jgi:integrase
MGSEKKVFPEFKICGSADMSRDWYVEWYDGNGKRHKRRTGINQHSTAKERRIAAEQLIEQIKLKLVPDQSTIEELAREWLDDFQYTVRKKTYYAYRGKIDDLFDFLNGYNPTPSLMVEYFKLKRRELHPTTYNKYLEQIGKIFREIDLPGDLLAGIQPMRAKSVPDRYYQKQQKLRLKRLISKEDPELWLFIQFIYYTFMRPNSELRMLQVMHLMLDEGKIFIPGTISKNRDSEYVAIPPIFLPTVREQYGYGAASDYLFPSRVVDDQPVSYNNMYARHRKYLKQLRFPNGYTLYSWRHTGAVNAIQNGVSVKDLQLQMRHKSLDQTDQYLRQMGVQQMRTIDCFPEL